MAAPKNKKRPTAMIPLRECLWSDTGVCLSRHFDRAAGIIGMTLGTAQAGTGSVRTGESVLRRHRDLLQIAGVEEAGVLVDDDNAGEVVAVMHHDSCRLAIGGKLKGKENGKGVAGVEEIGKRMRWSSLLRHGRAAGRVPRTLRVFEFGAGVGRALAHTFCDTGNFDLDEPDACV